MNIKDQTYIASFIIIVLNVILYKKEKLPSYTKKPLFQLIYLLCLLVILDYNNIIGFFIAMTYLIINKINNQ